MTTVDTPFEKARRKMVAARIDFIGQLAKFPKKEIDLAPAEGEWSALQLAHHVYIADGLAYEQMQIVQEEDNPLLIDVGQEAPRRTQEAEPPISLEAVLAGMAARREELFEYLSALPAEAWERPFRHPEWGQRKFYQLVNVLPFHDQMHAQQLQSIRESKHEEQ